MFASLGGTAAQAESGARRTETPPPQTAASRGRYGSEHQPKTRPMMAVAARRCGDGGGKAAAGSPQAADPGSRTAEDAPPEPVLASPWCRLRRCQDVELDAPATCLRYEQVAKLGKEAGGVNRAVAIITRELRRFCRPWWSQWWTAHVQDAALRRLICAHVGHPEQRSGRAKADEAFDVVIGQDGWLSAGPGSKHDALKADARSKAGLAERDLSADGQGLSKADIEAALSRLRPMTSPRLLRPRKPTIAGSSPPPHPTTPISQA